MFNPVGFSDIKITCRGGDKNEQKNKAQNQDEKNDYYISPENYKSEETIFFSQKILKESRMKDNEKIINYYHSHLPSNPQDRFIEACKWGFIKIVKELLKDERVDSTWGFTEACWSGQLDIVKLLKDEKVDPTHGFTVACQNGHLDIVKVLRKDKRIDWSPHGGNPLLLACKQGHLKIVLELLESRKVDRSCCVSFAAACKEGHLEIVKAMLKDKRAEWDPNDNSPLAGACRNGHLDIVKELLKDKRIQRNWNTPIGWACKEGHLEIVEELLKDEKVDPNLNFFFLETCEKGDQKTVKTTPLAEACRNGHIKIVKALLKDKRTKWNKNELIELAQKNNHLDIVKMLNELD